MALYYVSYDLDQPGQNYNRIIARLQQHGAQRILFSDWLVVSNWTAAQLRDDLWQQLDQNDRLFVGELKNSGAWQNLMVNNQTVVNFFNRAT